MRKKGVCCVEQSIEELKQRLFEATRRVRKSRSHRPLPEGITPAEGFVLMSISQLMSDGKRVRSGDIAKRGHNTPSATSQALRSLEEKGFITRHRDEGDSRGVTVRLTELGWKYEQMTLRLVVGFVLIFAAIVISETLPLKETSYMKSSEFG